MCCFLPKIRIIFQNVYELHGRHIRMKQSKRLFFLHHDQMPLSS